MWFSNAQAAIETSTFGSKFSAMQQANNLIKAFTTNQFTSISAFSWSSCGAG